MVLREEVKLLREQPPVLSPDEAPVSPLVGETADRVSQLIADTTQLRSDMMNLTSGFSAMEMRQDMALLCETSRLREEMHSVRALCQAVQTQLIHFAMERRKETVASAGKSVLNSALSALSSGSEDKTNTKL
ncbi:hypothetical protein HDU85_003016 [Gaertneriomyces sp. JEL0708]|nr:hypothetical protein HDU85_003016 [Gaertneriomyces sp. JEL0708]